MKSIYKFFIVAGFWITALMLNSCGKEDKDANRLTVAFIDSGIDYSYFEQNCIWKNKKEEKNGIDDDNNGYIDDIFGWNFLDSLPIQDLSEKENHGGHGTSICSVFLSYIQDNNIADIMSLKIYDDISDGEIDKLIEAIKYAEQNGAKICNLSLTTKEYSKELYETMLESEMLFVVSAGNGFPIGVNIDLESNYVYPACFDLNNMIVVASCNEKGKSSKFSNFGNENVDIFAKGEDVYISAYGTYGDGTSYSSAIVTSYVINELKNINNMKCAEIKTCFMEIVNDSGISNILSSQNIANV